ncbi:MAG: transposase [Deltaproteobacteria bacterium]|nr:transposase [Deltaproteobacteria bacterium]
MTGQSSAGPKGPSSCTWSWTIEGYLPAFATIYKDRWQIELIFNALKQKFKIKTFVGTSANAVKIQPWTLLLAMLVLRDLQLRSKAWSLSNAE